MRLPISALVCYSLWGVALPQPVEAQCCRAWEPSWTCHQTRHSAFTGRQGFDGSGCRILTLARPIKCANCPTTGLAKVNAGGVDICWASVAICCIYTDDGSAVFPPFLPATAFVSCGALKNCACTSGADCEGSNGSPDADCQSLAQNMQPGAPTEVTDTFATATVVRYLRPNLALKNQVIAVPVLNHTAIAPAHLEHVENVRIVHRNRNKFFALYKELGAGSGAAHPRFIGLRLAGNPGNAVALTSPALNFLIESDGPVISPQEASLRRLTTSDGEMKNFHLIGFNRW